MTKIKSLVWSPGARKSFLREIKNARGYSSAITNVTVSSEKEMQVFDENYAVDHMTNVCPAILDWMERKCHLAEDNPINLVKQKVYDHFQRNHVDENGKLLFPTFDHFSPITPEQSFDHLLIPLGHFNKSNAEVYYLNKDTILRDVSSVHLSDLIAEGYDRFLCTGDVYRHMAYNPIHATVFHQMDMQRLFTKEELYTGNRSGNIFEAGARTSKEADLEGQVVHTRDAVKLLMLDMRQTIEAVLEDLLGVGVKCRWKHYYCQFARPCNALFVMHQGEWLEILVGGVLRQEIVDKAGAMDKIGWNCRLGLDRLAMVLYNIPDIRLLQLKNNDITKILTSLDPNSSTGRFDREFAFLIPSDMDIVKFQYHFYELVRIAAEDSVQEVELVDQFPKTGMVAQRYRIAYHSWVKSLSESDVNCYHDLIKELAASKFKVNLIQ